MKEFMSKSSFSINDGYAKLIKKIEDRTLKSAVFGLGYVGWPLCKQIARSGFWLLVLIRIIRKLSL